MKKSTKVFCFLLSLILIITSFSGCGNKNSEGEIDENQNIITKDIKSAEVGEYVKFGVYEQDNDISNGKEKIEWFVLDKQNDKILVISKYALDCKPYNEKREAVTWEICTLRKWLNNEFMNYAFSADEIKSIVKGTSDSVFILSVAEAEKYLYPDDVKECQITDYAKAQGGYADKESNNCSWWLRTSGYDQYFASIVTNSGTIYKEGYNVYGTVVSVRPVMWITIE